MREDRKVKGAADKISNLPDVILQHILCFVPTTKVAISTSLLSRRWRHLCPNDNTANKDDRRQKIEGAEDLISNLPDVILQHILCFVPTTKDAISTSLLSRRWRYVWCEVPSLSLDVGTLTTAASVNEALTRYTAPKTKSFQLTIKYVMKNIPYMDTWIKFAMSHNVENLSLNFLHYYGGYKLLDFFYNSSSVKQLNIKLSGYNHTIVPAECTVSWTSLRNLSLTCCSLPDESMAKILSGCPILENLSLNFLRRRHHYDYKQLPDFFYNTSICCIVVFVASFAITTSLLSRRWKHVWCEIPSLSLDATILTAASVNRTLSHYTAPKTKRFHLKTYRREYTPHINRWIKFAMSHNVENLSLDFWVNSYPYKLPDFFYNSSSFKQLNINGCTLSDESLAKILTGCPILENLTLCHCSELRVLDLRKSLRLRTLQIRRNMSVPGPTQIVAPHIHSLRLLNSQLSCTFVDVASLTEAKLDICYVSILSLAEIRDVPFPIEAQGQNIDS
ncbi:hypothetical protein F2Q69_00031171 [Brassica cretica]|uniref:F-box domain-containing protein n=1 Tax=Brassica cretica TaxID=69181 RepID=A0A8S9RWP6_BRACR|nr:hypothetical protein F2Q69_00031171 [Brassica cretica]